MFIGLYFVLSPYFSGLEKLKENPELFFQSLNSALIFLGLGVSFSSLQDTTKTQNNVSKKIWEHPKKGKIAIIFMSLLIMIILIFGMIGYFVSNNGILKELSVGIIIFALGMFGLLKAAIEMFENHRLDKK
jgi:magnesium-transporting ATPase (P-type)